MLRTIARRLPSSGLPTALALVLLLSVAGAAHAQPAVDRLQRELAQQGYQVTEVRRTLLGRLRVVSRADGLERETVLTGSGTVLRDVVRRMGQGGNGSAVTRRSSTSSGSGAGLGAGSRQDSASSGSSSGGSSSAGGSQGGSPSGGSGAKSAGGGSSSDTAAGGSRGNSGGKGNAGGNSGGNGKGNAGGKGDAGGKGNGNAGGNGKGNGKSS